MMSVFNVIEGAKVYADSTKSATWMSTMDDFVVKDVIRDPWSYSSSTSTSWEISRAPPLNPSYLQNLNKYLYTSSVSTKIYQ